MAASFFFYDLETSGINSREARIMQFAGQRTDMNLKPIGEPVNVLIKLAPDTLPDPDAILVTGITPQLTLDEGLTEHEFLQLFYDEVATPGTIMTGYNSVRFDDEFMRCLNYRNFYDPYEWQWKDGRSRWDLLDVVRMTRALRPDGIKWPVTDEGVATNRLELITMQNGLDHAKAHDALSDVEALIDVARLLRAKLPQIFDYLLKMRDKTEVKKLIMADKPFVYSSGKYPSEYEKTTVAVMVAKHPGQDCALVYNLREDPTPFLKMSVAELVKAWQYSKDKDAARLPVKTLKYNRCPAVAPLGVLDEASQKRLNVDLKVINTNLNKLKGNNEFIDKLYKALEQMDAGRPKPDPCDEQTVDGKLYDGFIDNADKDRMRVVRAAEPNELAELHDGFKDERLKALLPLYKARNFPQTLSDEEREAWESFREHKLLNGGTNSRVAKFMKRLQELATTNLPEEKSFLLEELQLYAESIMPESVYGS